MKERKKERKRKNKWVRKCVCVCMCEREREREREPVHAYKILPKIFQMFTNSFTLKWKERKTERKKER